MFFIFCKSIWVWECSVQSGYVCSQLAENNNVLLGQKQQRVTDSDSCLELFSENKEDYFHAVCENRSSTTLRSQIKGQTKGTTNSRLTRLWCRYFGMRWYNIHRPSWKRTFVPDRSFHSVFQHLRILMGIDSWLIFDEIAVNWTLWVPKNGQHHTCSTAFEIINPLINIRTVHKTVSV